MPAFGPIRRADFISALRQAGFAGPFVGGRHEFMVKGQVKLVLPNPHRSDVGKPLLAEILRQAAISREEWEKL
jgi:predicted RNA binding protein YcfA (HicA-like mRNA interferase family)